ncbi:MAG: Hemagluttinin repeat-containing protein, partial [Planctomycetaceae bacterium]|nr:Hemagluttinin repeat-containing protein [Planctomycetaceae bacterium]
TVNGTFTWLRTAGYIMGPNGTGNATIECRGDIDNQNHGNTGNPYFTLDGTGYQTIKDTSGVLNYTGYSGGDFRGLTINKSGGGVILACDPLIYNGLSLVSGYVSTGPNWWFVADTSGTANIVSTAGSLNLGNVTLAGNIGSAFSTGLHVANLNLNGFGFTAPSVLYVSGDWTNSASAAFVAGTGTVIFNGTAANQNIVAGTVGFYNLTDANASGFSLNVTGTMIVNGTFTWLRTAGYIMGPNGTGNAAIECRGDIDNQNHGNTGNPYFTLDGTGYQTIKDTSGVLNVTGYSGGDFRGLTINKSGGGVILACDPLIYNGLKLQSGYVSTGTNWWFVGNTSGGTNIVSTAGSLSLGNVTLAGNIGAAFATGLHVANLNLNAFSFTAPSVLYVSGDWNNTAKAAFNANGGTVIFNGTGTQQKLTSGGKSFYNLTIAVGATVQLQDDLTYLVTLVTSGVLNRNGHKVNGV